MSYTGYWGLCMYYYFRYDDHDDHSARRGYDFMYLFLLGFPGQLGFHYFSRSRGLGDLYIGGSLFPLFV